MWPWLLTPTLWSLQNATIGLKQHPSATKIARNTRNIIQLQQLDQDPPRRRSKSINAALS
jgi:hypothetical protein